jgi:hypothetical protein
MDWPVEEPMKPKPNSLRSGIKLHIRSPHASPQKMWVMTRRERRFNARNMSDLAFQRHVSADGEAA